MIAKSTENPMVCDPLACAEKLCELLYLLRLVTSPGMDTPVAALNMLHGNLPSPASLVPMPRVYNRVYDDKNPLPPIAALPDGWKGSRFCFGGRRYRSAGEAAIYGLQCILFVLPNTSEPKDSPAWREFQWNRLRQTLLVLFRRSLTDLCEQAEDLFAAVQSEHDAYTARKGMEKPAVGARAKRKPMTDDEQIVFDAIPLGPKTILGKTIVERVSSKLPGIDESRISKMKTKTLKFYGVTNRRGAGYYRVA